MISSAYPIHSKSFGTTMALVDEISNLNALANASISELLVSGNEYVYILQEQVREAWYEAEALRYAVSCAYPVLVVLLIP